MLNSQTILSVEQGEHRALTFPDEIWGFNFCQTLENLSFFFLFFFDTEKVWDWQTIFEQLVGGNFSIYTD